MLYVPWDRIRGFLRLFWEEIKFVFVPGFGIACLIIWLVDFDNTFYYVISILVCFAASFVLMFRGPEQRSEFKGDA